MSFLLGVIAAGLERAGSLRLRDLVYGAAPNRGRAADGYDTAFDLLAVAARGRTHIVSAHEGLIGWNDARGLIRQDLARLLHNDQR